MTKDDVVWLPAEKKIDNDSRTSTQTAAAPEVWLRISAFLSMKSPATRTTYSGILKEWCEFLGAPAGTSESARILCAATDLHAISYRKYLETRPGERPRMNRAAVSSERALHTEHRSGRGKKKDGLDALQSNATIHKKFAALRRIYRMLLASDVGVKLNPFEADRVPPPPKDAGRKRPTQMVDFELVMEVLAQPDCAHAKGRRDKAILAVLFGAGLRRSEVIALRIGDVRKTLSGTTFLYLRYTKAKRDAEQALPEWAAEIVWQYVHERRSAKADDGDYLFARFTGQGGKTETNLQMSDTAVYSLFKSYCAAAGAGPFATPHSARATAITKLLTDGIPHREVQEFSRHASIQMVELYDKRRFSVEKNPAKGLSFDKKTK